MHVIFKFWHRSLTEIVKLGVAEMPSSFSIWVRALQCYWLLDQTAVLLLSYSYFRCSSKAIEKMCL
jgi:hypothetical protein